MSDTPITDENVIDVDHYISPGAGQYVSAGVARKLERELAAKQREVDSWRDAYEKAKAYTAELEKAKDSLRDAAIKANRKLEELSRQATIKEGT